MEFSGGFTISGGVTIVPPALPAYTLYSWGNNYSGALGIIDRVTRSSPTQVGATTDWVYNSGQYAIKNNNTLWSWGPNFRGQLGLGDDVARSSPVQVGTDTNWSKVISSGTSGEPSAGAIKTTGTLWMWGNNNNGRLGTNDAISRSSPTQVGSSTDWNQLSIGDFQTFAIKNNGTLWVWGSGLNGAQGLNDANVTRSSPTQIGSASDWSLVSSGNYTVAAIKTDGTLWTWGRNNIGQLGLNNGIDISSPTQVGSATNWSKVSAGAFMVLAVKTDGTLWSWGSEGNGGKLGLNQQSGYRSSPTQVGTATDWSLVSCSRYNARAIKTTGTLWSWGRNDSGSLGLNDIVARSSPTQVGARTDWYSSSGAANITASFGFTTT